MNMVGTDFKKHDIDYLMDASFESLTYDFNRTLNTFIIFEQNDNVIEIPKNKDLRIKAIDKIINFFVEKEEYDKCIILKKLKNKIINLEN